jgi:hydroxymethylbilane synthase
MTTAPIRIGTRGSDLALAQSGLVAAELARTSGRAVELVRIRTEGDVNRGPLALIGGTGVFVTAVRDALLSNQIDVAVHSFKDLPTADTAEIGIRIAAVPPREDPADVLCATGDLAELPAGARVGTGSPRRAAQLLRLRPDLTVLPVRGNVDTRLGLVSSGLMDGVVLARSGLARLGRIDAVRQAFSVDEMLPAPAQGALAVECRADTEDELLAAALAALDDPASRIAATAERALLVRLEAGCAAPVGALATVTDGSIGLRARVIAADGSAMLETTMWTPDHGPETTLLADATTLGGTAADELLARGAADLLGPGR